ncbi:MAG TPA: hypothetical protein VFB63_33730 [Bryobacteraceae bacterium]|nr:hypothetical protein [Bryobacteraceae bacterium]
MRSTYVKPIIASLASILMLAGCTHLGPRTLTRDRSDYGSAIAESWKEQTLLNIVKIRYMDLPVVLEVGQIVSGYSLETTANVGGQISSADALQRNSLLFGAQGKFTDRPTITYVPMTGDKFLRGLLTPIEPRNIFFLLQSGYAADFILGLTVESLNGLGNRSIAGGIFREAEPEFVRVLQLLREVQSAGGFGLRVEENKEKGQTAVLFFRRENVSPEALEKVAEIRRLLKVPPDQDRFKLVYSPARSAEDELAVTSRSMIQIMAAFASYVDAPAQHIKEQRATPGMENTSDDSASSGVRVHSGKQRPADAYVAIHYRDHWFWIDDRDWRTKRALTAVTFFFTLTDSGSAERMPLITIPAQ